MQTRRVAIAVPARNEASRIAACLARLIGLERDTRVAATNILVLANNCTDRTAQIARGLADQSSAHVTVLDIELESDRAHAGWARRLALDAAARLLRSPLDVLFCTDADTLVALDWLKQTLNYFDEGYDAVAGDCRLDPRELRRLSPEHRRRLAAIRRYEAALNYIRASRSTDEASPRHFYEGGASMALTLEAYGEIGGAPTPSVGEDKALFAALMQKGRRVRHPKDVIVWTSCRLTGRAAQGAADTIARWGRQGDGESLWGLRPLAAALGSPTGGEGTVSFDTLPSETLKARALVRAIRSGPPTWRERWDSRRLERAAFRTQPGANRAMSVIVRPTDERGVEGFAIGAFDTENWEKRLEREWWPRLRLEYPDPEGPLSRRTGIRPAGR